LHRKRFLLTGNSADIRPIAIALGAEIAGIDLFEDLDADTIAAIRRGLARRQEPARQPASTPKFPVSRGAVTYALFNRAAPLSRDRRPLRVLRNQNQRRTLADDERQRSLTPGGRR
jgi:hypothetical protein